MDFELRYKEICQTNISTFLKLGLKHTQDMMRCVTAKFTGISVYNQSEKVSALPFDQRVDRVMEGFINWLGLLTA